VLVRCNVLTSCRAISKYLGSGLAASVGPKCSPSHDSECLRNCVNVTDVLVPFLSLCLCVAYAFYIIARLYRLCCSVSDLHVWKMFCYRDYVNPVWIFCMSFGFWYYTSNSILPPACLSPCTALYIAQYKIYDDMLFNSHA